MHRASQQVVGGATNSEARCTTTVNRDLIVALAARNRLPAIYNFKHFVQAGGLMSYGIVSADRYRQAAFYVDRILRGAKPAELP